MSTIIINPTDFGGGGSSSVSISGGTGIVVTPNPITGTGSVAVGPGIPAAYVSTSDAIVSFTNTAGAQEFGQSVASTTFNWVMTRNGAACASQTVSGTSLVGTPVSVMPGTLRTYAATFSPSLTTTSTFSLATVGDDSYADSRASNVTFYWKRYWGPSTTNVLTGADVMSVLNPLGNEFATSRAASKSFTSGATPTYYYFAYPSAFGAIAGWTFNGFTQDVADIEYSNGVTFSATPTPISLTNVSGGTTNYYIARSRYQYISTTDTMAIS